jgi:RHS repeat-associated protein
VYGCFGWGAVGSEPQLAFTGVLREVAGGYLLGNGYRMYSPALRRFCSPDSLSPFGEGGINAYVYCVGDPINLADANGHSPISVFFMPTKKVAKVGARLSSQSPLKVSVAIGEIASGGAGKTVMDALNDVKSWKRLRGEAISLKFDLKGADPKLPKTKELLARQAEVNASFGTSFPGYSFESGLEKSVTTGRTMDTIVRDEIFAARVLVQELNRISPLPRNMRFLRSSNA